MKLKKLKRGFAAIDKREQKKLARQGGLTISQNKAHMSEIGRKGGLASGIKRRAAMQAKQAQVQPKPENENYSDSEAGRAGKFLGLGHDYVPGDPGL